MGSKEYELQACYMYVMTRSDPGTCVSCISDLLFCIINRYSSQHVLNQHL